MQGQCKQQCLRLINTKFANNNNRDCNVCSYVFDIMAHDKISYVGLPFPFHMVPVLLSQKRLGIDANKSV